MKIAILVLTVIGALGAGVLGMSWISDASKVKEAAELAKNHGVGEDPAVKASIAKAQSLVTAAYFLILAALVAPPAAVANMVMPAKGKIWGAVILGCALVPALFAAKTLVFTFFLLIAGGLCLASKSKAKVERPEPAYA